MARIHLLPKVQKFQVILPYLLRSLLYSPIYLSYSHLILGTALTLGAAAAGSGQEQIVFVLGGANPSSISATYWHLDTEYDLPAFTVPFDASQVVSSSLPLLSFLPSPSPPFSNKWNRIFTITLSCLVLHRLNSLWTTPCTPMLPQTFQSAL